MKEKEGLVLVAVDAAVFTIQHDDLKVLLIRRNFPPFKGRYALPGGFIRKDEEPWEAALRELEEETGIKGLYMAQLRVYGGPKRDPRGRVLSVAFVSLCQPDQALVPDRESSDIGWFPYDSLPELAFDHELIVKDALKKLQHEIQTTNIAWQILPDLFTMSMMQKLYEQILQRPLDKRNFRKRVRQLDFLTETREMHMDGAHRPARLFRFKDREYRPISDRIHVFL